MTWEEAFRQSAKKYYDGEENFMSKIKEVQAFSYDKSYFDKLEEETLGERANGTDKKDEQKRS